MNALQAARELLDLAIALQKPAHEIAAHRATVARLETGGDTLDETRAKQAALLGAAPAPAPTAPLNPWGDYGTTVAHEGVTIHVTVSPCSLMHTGYGLQVQLSQSANAANIASEFVLDKTVDPTRFTSRDELMGAAVRLANARLSQGDLLALLAKRQADGDQLRADFEAEDAKRAKAEAKRLAKRKAARKAEGFTHYVLAVIHPARGDDYMVEAFVRGAPTPADLKKITRASVAAQDVRVEAL